MVKWILFPLIFPGQTDPFRSEEINNLANHIEFIDNFQGFPYDISSNDNLFRRLL